MDPSSSGRLCNHAYHRCSLFSSISFTCRGSKNREVGMSTSFGISRTCSSFSVLSWASRFSWMRRSFPISERVLARSLWRSVAARSRSAWVGAVCISSARFRAAPGRKGSQLAALYIEVQRSEVRRKQLPDSWPRSPVDDELQSEKLPIQKRVSAVSARAAGALLRGLGLAAKLERRIWQELDREVRERAHQCCGV